MTPYERSIAAFKRLPPEFCCGPLWFRPMMRYVDKGFWIPGHKHEMDHVTILLAGGLRFITKSPNGGYRDEERWAPDYLLIKAGVEHEFTALVDGTAAMCSFGHLDANGNPVAEYCGNDRAYGLVLRPVMLPAKGPGGV